MLVSALVFVVGASTFARADGALPSLLASYRISNGNQGPEQLDLLRTDTRIEYRLHGGEVTEVWERNERGDLTHLKVFSKARRIVHYTSGDLRTLNLAPSWEELGSLMRSEDRKELTRRGTTRIAGEPAQRFVGLLGKAPATLLWLEQLGVPGQLSVGRGPKRHTVKLVGVKQCSPDVCAPVDITGYREIEFADLGDSEHDPFVRNFVAATGLGHAH